MPTLQFMSIQYHHSSFLRLLLQIFMKFSSSSLLTQQHLSFQQLEIYFEIFILINQHHPILYMTTTPVYTFPMRYCFSLNLYNSYTIFRQPVIFLQHLHICIFRNSNLWILYYYFVTHFIFVQFYIYLSFIHPIWMDYILYVRRMKWDRARARLHWAAVWLCFLHLAPIFHIARNYTQCFHHSA
jgi:hypothetical protein